MKTENKPTYMTVKVISINWSEIPQTYLGNIAWGEAVKIAKAQGNEVRLCHSSGYDNQGHYIQPDKYYTNPNQLV